jgi:hypothetical protein
MVIGWFVTIWIVHDTTHQNSLLLLPYLNSLAILSFSLDICDDDDHIVHKFIQSNPVIVH